MEIDLENVQKTEIGLYLKTPDKQALIGKETPVVISQIQTGQFKSKLDVIIYLNGVPKIWTLNHKNKNDLIDMFGSNTKDWLGKPFIITAKYINMDTPTGHKEGVEINIEKKMKNPQNLCDSCLVVNCLWVNKSAEIFSIHACEDYINEDMIQEQKLV